MKWNWGKVAVLVLFFAALGLFVFQSVRPQSRIFPSRAVTQEMTVPPEVEFEIPSPLASSSPPPAPMAESSSNLNGLYVTADFLYWQPSEDMLEYAWEFTFPDGENLLNIRDHKFDWEPGFRVGAGYHLPFDRWDLYLNWTHLSANNTVQAGEEGVNHVFDLETNSPPPFFSDASPTYRSPEAFSYMHLSFNTLDFEMGRRFQVSCSFQLRPHFGIRGVTIDQTRKVHYGPTIEGNPGSFGPPFTTDVKGKNDFFAIGPRVGANGKWIWGRGFGVIGQCSASLVYGKFTLKNTSFADPFVSILQNEVRRVRPNLQMLLGLDWTYRFCRCREFNLAAGYELQCWWNQMLLTSISEVHHPDGDLMFQGLTVQSGFSF